MVAFLRKLDRDIASFVLVIALLFYRATIGVLFRGCCRFHPSCSHYSEEAIRKYGAVRGAWLGCIRLTRCHPFSRGGVDLVP